MWKGSLRLQKHEIQFKLYAAVEDAGVHFHLLHAKDDERVEQRMIDPSTGKAVASEDVHKAYEVSRGTFVMMSDDELAELVPEASRDVTVHTFLPADAIPPGWYERPYYLGPDGSTEAYFALAHALKESGRIGVASWVMRNRQYHGVLRPEGEYLVLVTLHSKDQVVETPRMSSANSSGVSDRESKMATQLVTALEGEFDPSDFKSEHREKLLSIIEAKAKGKKLPRRAAPKKATVTSLSSALEASLGNVKKERKSA